MTNFSVDAILRDACGTEFTGAVARIERGGRVVFERAYGVTRADELARPVYCDSLFDLASLTKLFVSTMALHAVASGVLQLDAPLAQILTEWRDTDRERITLRMLLAHTSGMDSGADYRRIRNENVERFALNAPLLARPGERVIYSDLGFIALGVALERAALGTRNTKVLRLVLERLQPRLELRRATLARHARGGRRRSRRQRRCGQCCVHGCLHRQT